MAFTPAQSPPVTSARTQRDEGFPASAPSPLDIALAKKQEVARKNQRMRSTVLDAVLTEAPAELQRRTANDPATAHDWTSALQTPVQMAVERVVSHTPERMAQALAPVMPQAIQLKAQSTRRKMWEGFGRFLSGLGHAKVWRWMIEALWEGEPVSDYVEQRAGSCEVVELILHDLQGQKQLAYAALPGVTPRPDSGDEDADVFADEGKNYMFVGERCKLAARVMGQVKPELKRTLQALCYDLDHLLDDTALDSSERARLIPLKLRAGLSRVGPFSNVNATRKAVTAAVAVGVVVLSLISWIGLGEYRWQRFLEILQREPGIQVTRYERAWGRSSVEGVRIEGSRDPVALAQSLGLDPDDMNMRFKTAITGTGLVQELKGTSPVSSVSTLPSTATNSSEGEKKP